MTNKNALSEKCELFLKDFVDAQAKLYLEDDAYYEGMATPLKPASLLKKEHLEHIKNTLLMKEFRDSLSKAISLIFNDLSKSIRPDEFAKIKNELENILDFLAQPVEEDKSSAGARKPILFHKMWKISDNTLQHLHHFSNSLIHEKNYEDANAMLTFLVTLAPEISRFWSSRALCLQALHRDDEAFQVLNIAKILSPDDPVPLIYNCNGLLRLKEKQKALDELKNLQACMEAHPDTKNSWKTIYQALKEQISKL